MTKVLTCLLLLLLLSVSRCYSQDFSVYFDTDSYKLSPESRKLLDSICESKKYGAAFNYTLSGFADKRGSIEHNKALIINRIREVSCYIVENHSVPFGQIKEAEVRNLYDSLLPNHLNRRVVIQKTGMGDCYVAPPRTLILRFPPESNVPHLHDACINDANNSRRDNHLYINKGYECYPCSEFYFDINGDADIRDLKKWFVSGSNNGIVYTFSLSDFKTVSEDITLAREIYTMEYTGKPVTFTAIQPAPAVKKKKGLWAWVKRIFKKRKND